MTERTAHDPAERTLTAFLRSHTSAVHRALDESFTERGWFTHAAAATDYAARIARADASVAALIDEHPATHVSGRRRSTTRSDLAVSVAPPSHPDCAVGALYVTEGSALGGRHLARDLRRRAATDPALAEVLEAVVAIVDPYGEQTPARWRRTVAAIDRSGVDRDHALTGALWAFRVYDTELVRPSHGVLA